MTIPPSTKSKPILTVKTRAKLNPGYAGKPKPPTTTKKKATFADWLKQPEELHAELIDGKLVYETMGNSEHGRAWGKLISNLNDAYDRPPGQNGKPGGWWLAIDVDMKLGPNGLRPDLVGWRRDKHPTLPKTQNGCVKEVPDWVAEILSPSTMNRDWGDKHRIYYQHKVSHYWLLDPKAYTLTTLVWTKDGYEMTHFGKVGDIVQAEPFEQVAISIRELFGIEEAAEEKD